MNDDPFSTWRIAVTGKPVPIHDGEPWAGYFKMRDRRNDMALPKGSKRPWIACSIYFDWRGTMVAELDGDAVPPGRLWPYAASNPIPYDEYLALHQEHAQ